MVLDRDGRRLQYPALFSYSIPTDILQLLDRSLSHKTVYFSSGFTFFISYLKMQHVGVLVEIKKENCL